MIVFANDPLQFENMRGGPGLTLQKPQALASCESFVNPTPSSLSS